MMNYVIGPVGPKFSAVVSKELSYKMGKFNELKNAQNNCSFTDINFCDWAKKVFLQLSF